MHVLQDFLKNISFLYLTTIEKKIRFILRGQIVNELCYLDMELNFKTQSRISVIAWLKL